MCSAQHQPPDILVQLSHRGQLPVRHRGRLELAEGIGHPVRTHRTDGRQGVTPQLGTVQRVILRHGERRQVRHGKCLAAMVAGGERLNGAPEPSFGLLVPAAVERQAEQRSPVVPLKA